MTSLRPAAVAPAARRLHLPRFVLPVGFALLVAFGVAAPLLALLGRSAARAAPYADPPFRQGTPQDGVVGWTAAVQGIPQLQDAALETLMRLSGALVLLLLAVALVDLLTLLLARGAVRRREAALRAALGATPLRLARRWLAEAAAVALPALAVGALLGVGVARGAAWLWPHEAPPWLGTGPAWRPQLAVVGGTLLTAALAWLSPLGVAWRRDLRRFLGAGGRATAGPGEVAARSALVVVQLAASLVLLMSAGLLLRAFVQPADAGTQALGYDAAATLALRVELPAGTSSAARAAAYGALIERVAAVPGVVDTSVATPGAWVGLGTTDRVTAVCAECRIGMMIKPISVGPAQVHAVSAGHFRALGATLARGREFDDGDGHGAAPVAVVSRAFALRLFPGGDPLGKRVRVGGEAGGWYTVVGIVEDIRARGIGVGALPEPAVFLAVMQRPPSTVGLAVRAGDGPPDAALVEAAVRAAVPAARTGDALPMHAYLERFGAPLRWFGTVLGAVAVLSLVLAAVGLHGVMRYHVDRRSREIGIRVALGATRREIVAMVMRQAGRTTRAGIILGLWAALSVARLLQVWFRGVEIFDPLLFGGLAALLAAITLAAAYRPARRALDVDPRVALHAE